MSAPDRMEDTGAARRGFGRALLLAAAGAGALPVLAAGIAPWTGGAAALGLAAAAVAAAWAPVCTPRARGSAVTAAGLALLGTGLALGGAHPARVAVALAAGLGAARAAWLLPGRPGPVLLREAAVLGAGIALARAWGGTAAPLAAAWALLLVQAGAFAWPARGGRARAAQPDAFERAAARLRALTGDEAAQGPQ